MLQLLCRETVHPLLTNKQPPWIPNNVLSKQFLASHYKEELYSMSIPLRDMVIPKKRKNNTARLKTVRKLAKKRKTTSN